MRHLRHLATRFFGVLRARPLAPAEQAEIDGWLRPEEQALFWGQQPADQRHALEAALRCLEQRPDRHDLARAALLHDVGKRHARLGVPGRVAASLLRIVGIPAPGRLGVYLAHGDLGADDLVAAGAEPLVIAFARHHHEAHTPAGVSSDDWSVLRHADGE